jgi:zinc transporter, ZIP family
VHKKEGRTQRVERSFWICFAACALMVLIGFCIVSAGADDGAVREYARPLCNSVLAGLSTGLGGLVVLLMGIPSNEVMAGVLGLAAGVMLTVSVFDMWLPAVRQHGIMTPSIGFAIGWVVFVVLDYCIPESLASGEMDADGGDEEAKGPEGSNQAWRLAILMAITLTIHNVPEGIAVVVSSIESWRGGTIMTLAISLHNIPEGLVIATPCYASTGSKRAAILLSLASGL